MGVRILYDSHSDMAALYCSTTDVAFGPVFSGDDSGHDANERVEAFTRWLRQDARTFSDSELQLKYSEWLTQEPAQWAAEEAAEMERFS